MSVKNFNYTNSKGETKNHTVFLLSETPDYLMGIDVDALVTEEKNKDIVYNELVKILGKREPTQYQTLAESKSLEKKPIEGFDKSWFRAFRNFKKSNIKES